MDIREYLGEDYKAILDFESWRIGMLHYSERFAEFKEEERHLLTDEAFILLEGEATLYEERIPYKMEKCKVYNIKKGLWHQIVMSKDATAIVVENSNTSKENSERRSVV